MTWPLRSHICPGCLWENTTTTIRDVFTRTVKAGEDNIRSPGCWRHIWSLHMLWVRQMPRRWSTSMPTPSRKYTSCLLALHSSGLTNSTMRGRHRSELRRGSTIGGLWRTLSYCIDTGQQASLVKLTGKEWLSLLFWTCLACCGHFYFSLSELVGTFFYSACWFVLCFSSSSSSL